MTQQPWMDDYENERSHFLVYDKASGSRWLNDEYLQSFFTTQVAAAEERGRNMAIDYVFKNWNNHAVYDNPETFRVQLMEEARSNRPTV